MTVVEMHAVRMDEPNPDYEMQLFESRKWPGPVRLAVWRDLLCRKLLHVEIEPKSTQPFKVAACVRTLPGLRFGWGTFDASINRRTREIVSQDDDDIVLIVNLDDTLHVSQGRRDMSLRAGDAHALSCSDEVSFARSHPGRILCMRMERKPLAALVPRLESNLSRVVPRENEALQMLTRYVMKLDNSQSLTEAKVREGVIAHVRNLAALTLGSTRDGASRRGLRAVRLSAIKDHIAANLGRRDLSVETVATAFALTERYVQRLFEAEGTTFTYYVLERRLSRAFQYLNDVQKGDRSISSLAFECGFGDISYFNRVFRRRFGAPPRDLRAVRVVS